MSRVGSVSGVAVSQSASAPRELESQVGHAVEAWGPGEDDQDCDHSAAAPENSVLRMLQQSQATLGQAQAQEQDAAQARIDVLKADAEVAGLPIGDGIIVAADGFRRSPSVSAPSPWMVSVRSGAESRPDSKSEFVPAPLTVEQDGEIAGYNLGHEPSRASKFHSINSEYAEKKPEDDEAVHEGDLESRESSDRQAAAVIVPQSAARNSFWSRCRKPSCPSWEQVKQSVSGCFQKCKLG